MISLVLMAAQVAAPQMYDHNGNTLNNGPVSRAAGSILSTVSGPAGPSSGAGFDGTNLTVTSGYDGAAVIYTVDQATGGTLGTVPILNSGDFGLGYDDSRGLHVTSNASTDVISTFTSAGVQLNSWFVGGGPVGVAYDNVRDQYWVVDWSANTLYQVDPVSGAIGTSWSTAAFGCTRGAGVGYDAASDTLLVGGRDQNTVFVVDPATGLLLNSWAANDGSNNPQGMSGNDGSSAWQTSWNSNLLTQFDLGGPSGPTLTITGTCPGLMTFDVSGGTAFGALGLAYGPAGSFTIGGGGCAGTTLGISAPSIAGVFGLDVNGDLSFSATIPSGACGLTVQGLDLSNCDTTNTATL